MSAVVAVKSAIVTPPPSAIVIASSPSVYSIKGVFKLVLAVTVVPDIVVNVPAAALAPPIIAPSTVPPLMSAVSATKLSMFAVPSINKSSHSAPEAPKS